MAAMSFASLNPSYAWTEAPTRRCYGAGGEEMAPSSLYPPSMERPMRKFNDQSKALVALDQDSTLIAVIEMSQSCWLVGGLVPGLAREPAKKLAPDAEALLRVLHRWRDEAIKAGCEIRRICVAYEAGRDGFWLHRFLTTEGIQNLVVDSSSIEVKG